MLSVQSLGKRHFREDQLLSQQTEVLKSRGSPHQSEDWFAMTINF